MNQPAETQPLSFSAPIPTPDYFPIHWDDPADVQAFWERDAMHFPLAVTPLMESFFVDELYPALGKAFHAYGAPAGFVPQSLNGYIYNSPRLFVSPEQLEAAGKIAEEKLGAAMASQEERWAANLAEIKTYLAAWEAFQLQDATNERLRTYLDETVTQGARCWEIHFLTVLPAYQAVSIFDDLYRDLFGNESAFDAYILLQGYEDVTKRGTLALWRLSREALQSPEAHRILEEQPAGDVIPALGGSSEGRAFLLKLQAYLTEWGQRLYDLDLASPSWIEDPTIVIKNLKDYVAQPDRYLEAEMAAEAEVRDRAVALAREKLCGYPEQVVSQFEFFLNAAQVGNRLTEDHNWWIDNRVTYQVHRVLVEIGRRLAGGAIEHPEDVFFLTLDELRAGLSAGVEDLRGVIAERRERLTYFQGVQAPPVLGTMPSAPPPDDPGTRFIMKFFGGPPKAQDEPGVIKGTAGSPGVVRGVARVVHSLADAERLGQGEILVTETTAPPWTPLFATAGAIVTDAGGVLSHSAIVAREYRIPAVVATTVGTHVIQDGQVIEIDGNQGIVRLLGGE